MKSVLFLILLLLFWCCLFQTSISKKHHKLRKHQTSPPTTTTYHDLSSIPTENCSCSSSGSSSNPCRGGLYVYYYYNAPYSGYPANSSHLPEVDAVPIIVEKLTSIRDTLKSFLQALSNEGSDVQRAIYVKNNFGNVQYILEAINNSANSTNLE